MRDGSEGGRIGDKGRGMWEEENIE